MFKHLSDLSYTRSGKEALGFYLAYLLLIILADSIAGFLFGGVDSMNNFYAGVDMRTVVAVISSLLLTYLICMQKKRKDTFSTLLFTLIAGLMAMVGGGILGLIIPSVLTTTGAKSKSKKRKK